MQPKSQSPKNLGAATVVAFAILSLMVSHSQPPAYAQVAETDIAAGEAHL